MLTTHALVLWAAAGPSSSVCSVGAPWNEVVLGFSVFPTIFSFVPASLRETQGISCCSLDVEVKEITHPKPRLKTDPRLLESCHPRISLETKGGKNRQFPTLQFRRKAINDSGEVMFHHLLSTTKLHNLLSCIH